MKNNLLNPAKKKFCKREKVSWRNYFETKRLEGLAEYKKTEEMSGQKFRNKSGIKFGEK